LQKFEFKSKNCHFNHQQIRSVETFFNITCFRHWLNTAAGGIVVSLHLTVPVLHVIQLDIFYLFAAAPCCRPSYFQPWFTGPTVHQPPASPSQPYLLHCLPYYTSPLFGQTTKKCASPPCATATYSSLSPTASHCCHRRLPPLPYHPSYPAPQHRSPHRRRRLLPELRFLSLESC
jgi:hypothetical protein